MGTHFRDHDSYTQILEVTPNIRRRLEATIDHLIDLLDSLDPNPDVHPDDDPAPDNFNEPQGGDESWLAWMSGKAT